MTDQPFHLVLELPDWVADELPDRLHSDDERMHLVIRLARMNVDRATGGPFGAAVFEHGSGALVAAGVNVVLAAHCSAAHAEVMALALAQRRLGTHDLSEHGRYDLVTSCEPCSQCLGATEWSGVRRLVCGARGEDAEAAGFDEGIKPPAWPERLAERGVEVVRDLDRDEAAAVLAHYAATGGPDYSRRAP